MVKTKTVETLTAKVYLGLKEGYGNTIHTINEVKDFVQEYCDNVGLCVTVTSIDFIYRHGREPGAVIGLINYPRFPKTKSELEKTAEEIALMCKERYKQKRISIEYQDRTVMLE